MTTALEVRLSPDGTRIAVKYPHNVTESAFPWKDPADNGRYADDDVADWRPLAVAESEEETAADAES